MEEFLGKAVVAREVVAADAALAIHQDEARAVAEAAIPAIQLEGGEAEIVEARHFAGEEVPAFGVGLEVGSVSGEHGRRVVDGIDGEADELQFGRGMGGILDAAHLVTHHGAGAGAGGEDEVGHPDMAVERVAVEGLTGLRGELELRYLAEDGQGLYGYAGGEEEEEEH